MIILHNTYSSLLIGLIVKIKIFHDSIHIYSEHKLPSTQSLDSASERKLIAWNRLPSQTNVNLRICECVSHSFPQFANPSSTHNVLKCVRCVWCHYLQIDLSSTCKSTSISGECIEYMEHSGNMCQLPCKQYWTGVMWGGGGGVECMVDGVHKMSILCWSGTYISLFRVKCIVNACYALIKPAGIDISREFRSVDWLLDMITGWKGVNRGYWNLFWGQIHYWFVIGILKYAWKYYRFLYLY